MNVSQGRPVEQYRDLRSYPWEKNCFEQILPCHPVQACHVYARQNQKLDALSKCASLRDEGYLEVLTLLFVFCFLGVLVRTRFCFCMNSSTSLMVDD